MGAFSRIEPETAKREVSRLGLNPVEFLYQLPIAVGTGRAHQLKEPLRLVRWLQPDQGQLVVRRVGIARLAELAFPSHGPVGGQERLGDLSRRTGSHRVRREHCIDILRADGFALVVAEEVIASGQTADDDHV
jgi:hypothetical protein